MTTKEVASRYYELAQTGRYDLIVEELYSDDAESHEPEGSNLASVHGKEAIREKAAQFQEQTEEVHSGWCGEPVVGDKYFSCAMGMDITLKGMPRMNMDEVCVFKVIDGKIVSEQFFYTV
ncbi:MAG: SnoaL-like domain-containing protein [Saprospiraceae bacterium]